MRPRLVALTTGLLLVGTTVLWAVRAYVPTVSAISGDLYGQPRAAVPPALVGSWPAVLTTGAAMVVLAATTLVSLVAVARGRGARRRPAPD